MPVWDRIGTLIRHVAPGFVQRLSDPCLSVAILAVAGVRYKPVVRLAPPPIWVRQCAWV